MKSKCFWLIAVCFFAAAVNVCGQKSRLGKICGNPNVKCRTTEIVFDSFEIPFETSKNAVISSSEPFYAVILQSVSTSKANCGESLKEDKRLEVQKLFPNNKVFVLKCDDYNSIFYSGVAQNVGFMAVYAGKTLAEAKAFLKRVEATGKFKGINVRKLQAEINGT